MSINFTFFTRVIGDDLEALREHIKLYSGATAGSEASNSGSPVWQFANYINSEISSIQGRIQDLLLLSGEAVELEFEHINLSELVREVLEQHKSRSSQQLIDVLIQHDLKARGDRILLEKLFYNLVNNAWKFSLGRDPATIEFGAIEMPNGVPEFYLRDNGMGMDQKQLDYLDTPIPGQIDRSRGSLKLGYAIAKCIVELHGGNIHVQSQVNAGTTVFFTLS